MTDRTPSRGASPRPLHRRARTAARAALALGLAAGLAGCGGDPQPDAARAAAAGPGHLHGHGEHAAGGDAVLYYTCSMHPSVESAGPGTCPICSMDLVPVTRREAASGEVVLDAARRQEIGVTTARVEVRPLAVPVRAAGEVTWDESRLSDVSLKVGGWIGELYADRTGVAVRRGEPLLTLYSPELYAAQREYLTALESQRAARGTGAPDRADYLVEAARERLRLWDLSAEQIDRLAAGGAPLEHVPILSPASGYVVGKYVVAGAAVQPGATLLRIAGLDRVWVEADVFESELPLLAVGAPAKVVLPHLPGRTFEGRIAFVYPWLDGAGRTGRVRVELANPDLALKPEMFAEVVFESALGERLAVPEEAVLYAGDRRFVFLDLGDGRLRPQPVTIGQRAGEWVEVVDGLEEGDTVVTSANFLVAAEARLKLALEHWGS